MRGNLDASRGLLLSERVMFVLGQKIGKQTAHEVLYEIAMKTVEDGTQFVDELAKDSRVTAHFGIDQLRELFDPASYVGCAAEMLDAVLARE